MSKGFRGFLMVWAALFALFTAIIFLGPVLAGNTEIFKQVGFWIEYVLFAGILVGNLIFIKATITDETPTETFYALNYADKALRGVFISFVIAIICALLPIPKWIGIIICAVILIYSAMSVAAPKVAATEVERIDKEVKEKTFFIKSLTIDAETLTDRAKDEETKAACRKVAEALRYSDPMSSSALATSESAITIKFSSLQSAVMGGDKEKSLAEAEELIILINDRNRKCKLLK